MAVFTRTMAMVTVMAWSFWIKALNICFTETVSIAAVDFSLTFRQVRPMKTINSTPTMAAKYLKPTTSISFAPAFSPANMAPSRGTSIMVKTVMMAAPTPAQLRAMVVRFSRSLPPWVKAGIMDQ